MAIFRQYIDDAPITLGKAPVTQTNSGKPTGDGDPNDPDARGSLRGTFTAVVLMAIFFVLAWAAVMAIAMDRR